MQMKKKLREKVLDATEVEQVYDPTKYKIMNSKHPLL